MNSSKLQNINLYFFFLNYFARTLRRMSIEDNGRHLSDFFFFIRKASEMILEETLPFPLNTGFSWLPGIMPTPFPSPFPYLQPSNDGMPQASYFIFMMHTLLVSQGHLRLQSSHASLWFLLLHISWTFRYWHSSPGLCPRSSGLTDELLWDFFQALLTQYL